MRLFSSKPQPKQDHPSTLDAHKDGPYARCECGEIIDKEDVHICLDPSLLKRPLSLEQRIVLAYSELS